MHLHWKYRELIKIICKEKRIETVHQIAQTLEAESGGILVAVERVSKGYAIIVYRGKNYERPACIRPQTLLNKKAAMKRSLEAQRREVKLTSLSLQSCKCLKLLDIFQSLFISLVGSSFLYFIYKILLISYSCFAVFETSCVKAF